MKLTNFNDIDEPFLMPLLQTNSGLLVLLLSALLVAGLVIFQRRKKTVSYRLRQLESALKNQGMDARSFVRALQHILMSASSTGQQSAEIRRAIEKARYSADVVTRSECLLLLEKSRACFGIAGKSR